MAPPEFLVALAGVLREVVRPLEQALESPIEFAALMREHGWHVEGDATPAVEVFVQRLDIEARLHAFESALSELVATPRVTLTDAGTLLDGARELLGIIKSMGAGPTPSGAIAPLNRPEFWSNFGVDLAQTLCVYYLELNHPALFAVLHLIGVIDRQYVPSDGTPGRVGYTRNELHWERLGKALTDPTQLATEMYGWGAELQHEKLTEYLQRALYAFGIPVRRRLAAHRLLNSFYAPENRTLDSLREVRAPLIIKSEKGGDRVEFGLTLLPIPGDSNPDGAPVGVLIGPYAEGEFGGHIPLGGFFELAFKGGFAADDALCVELRPGSTKPRLTETTSVLDAGMTLIGTPFKAWIPVGQEDGSRVEVHDVSLGLEMHGTPTDPELCLRLGTSRINLVLDVAEGDGFLRSLLGAESHTFTTAGAVVWSSKRGLTFEGSGSLILNLPIDRSIAGVKILVLSVAINASQVKTTLTASITANASLGPVVVAVQDIGIELRLDQVAEGQRSGNFGDLDLSFGFKPPNGLGLVVEAPSITGGGYLAFASEKEEYSGILQLQIAEKISVKAVCLLTTRIPGGGGYSLVALIFVEGFTPIQLGLGFVLTGIGGLLAINRTFDEEALRSGLKNDALDSLMFPKDPVRNAHQIISNINRVFPPAVGHHLFGPMLQIAWGTPALITAELAVVLEFGARQRLLVLAQIESILPTRDNELLSLRMDAVGVIDFDQGTAAIDATLHHSQLLQRYSLTGDMAMRLRWGSEKNFALAVGGLHPAYNPPPNFPKLERITINLSAGNNPRLICQAYFAITTNTLQFGARAEFYAEGAAGFKIQGHIGFDVLIQRAPFHFLAEFDARLQLKRNSTNLFAVRVQGSLEGPRPLHIKAKATFEILWWDVSISVNTTLFEGELPSIPLPVDVLPLLREALKHPDNWIASLPDSSRPMVTLREKPAAENEVLLHPLGSLTVKQGIVPLNMEISLFGTAPPTGARNFTLAASLGDGAATPQWVRDSFIPAQFIEMSDDQKLSRPSFEEMDAGVTFGSEEFVFTNNPADRLEVNKLDFETRIVDLLTQEGRDGDPVDAHGQKSFYQIDTNLLTQQIRYGAAARSDLRRTGKARFRTKVGKNRVEREGWSFVETETLTSRPVPGFDENKPASYAEAELALRRMKLEDPSAAVRWKILRSRSELSET